MRRRSQGASPRIIEAEVRVWPKWLALLAGVMILLAGLIWGTMQLMNPQTMPLTSVRIDTPLAQVKPEELREHILPHAEGGFIHLDVNRLRQDLEALAWVERASVRRAWPDVLVISIREQQAVARWADGGLLNPRGERFTPAQEDMLNWGHLPLLRGPDASEQVVLKQYLELQAMVAPLDVRISHLTMDERRAWSLQLEHGMHIGLGRTDVERRLMRFVRVYPRVLQPRLVAIESVDMRYTNGFAIRWRDGMQPAAA